MRISELRSEVSAGLRAFAWDEWAQMGLSADTARRDRWAADPEALLLLTLEVGRDEPRLFDELLDWLVVNERIVSVQRLRNLSVDDEDRALAGASLGWVAVWRPRARLSGKAERSLRKTRAAQPLYRGTKTPITQPDEAFLRHGLLKAQTKPSGHSGTPDLGTSINFAFRLRHLLGVGARAEVARVLLCSGASRLSAQTITASAAYSKRNVQEALTALDRAGVIEAISVGNEQRYTAPRERWSRLLGLAVGDLPTHREWPQLLHALRRLVRWLSEERLEALSDYMRASEARAFMEEIAPDLRFAGVPVPDDRGRGAGYWPVFVETAQAAVAAVS